MFNIAQFRELIVKSSLRDLMLYSKNAEELLIFTCAAESLGGTDLQGQGLGIFNMNIQTYNDLFQNYIKPNSKHLSLLVSNFQIHQMPSEERMIYDLRFATAMAALYYFRLNIPLPDTKDIQAIWDVYRIHYHVESNKLDAIGRYNMFIGN